MSGSCESCGCTTFDPCVLDDGQPCAWADPDHTLCTACEPPRHSLLSVLDPLFAEDEPRLYLPFAPGSKQQEGP